MCVIVGGLIAEVEQLAIRPETTLAVAAVAREAAVVDREHGIVFAFAFFDHEQINWTWQLGELFKIENGQIRASRRSFIGRPAVFPRGGARSSRPCRRRFRASGD